MSTESCVSVAIQEEQLDTVGLIVSAIAGLIVGAIIGFIIFKCFLVKNQCFATQRAVGTKDTPEEIKPLHTALTYENNFAEKSSTPESAYKRRESESDDDINEETHRQRFFVLDDFVSDMTWDRMILELGKQELFELMRLELSMWEERHICILQLYRCTLNYILAGKYITDSQYHEILSNEERMLSAAFKKMKDDWESYIKSAAQFKGQSLIDSFSPFNETYSDNIKNMISVYRESSHRFAAKISLSVDNGNTDALLENLIMQIDAVEGFFRENQDEMIESCHLVFRGFGVTVRELVVTLICESELNRLLTATCNTALEKLVKTGRISSESKESVKDSLPEDFNISREEVKDVFSQMHPNILSHFESLLQQSEEESTNVLKSILSGYQNQTTPDGFVQSYLTACCEQKLQRMGLLKDLADGEQSGIVSKLIRLSQIQDEKRFEVIRVFCQQLEENDALSRNELQQMRQDFARKLDATRGKVFSTCKRNITELWRMYDQHCGRQQEEGNRVDASILQDSVTDELVSLEDFLHLQTSLSNEDQHTLMQERESLFLLLINQINTFRAKWFHVIENDLAKCQAFLLVKKSTDLVNDTIAEILGIVERLWNERNSMREYVRESASLSCMQSILGASREEICKVLSRRLVKNLVGKQLPEQSERLLLESVQKALINEISAKNSFSNFASVTQDHNERLSRLIKEELNKHNLAISVVEEDIGAAHLKRQGRLKFKAQRIAQHTPPPGTSSTDIQPYLEQLLIQNQVSRATDSVESESIRQNLMESLNLDKSTIEALSGISKNSEALLISKFSVLAGLTKSEFIGCLNRAKKITPSQGNARSVTQKFSKFWKDALAYVESISY